MADRKVYKGFGFPIERSSRGYFFQAVDVNLVKGDLIQLLLTEPGERVMAPSWGTGLRSLIFEQSDNFIVDEAKEKVANAIAKFEPRIVVKRLDVVLQEEQQETDRSLKITIEFALKDKLINLDTLDLIIRR